MMAPTTNTLELGEAGIAGAAIVGVVVTVNEGKEVERLSCKVSEGRTDRLTDVGVNVNVALGVFEGVTGAAPWRISSLSPG